MREKIVGEAMLASIGDGIIATDSRGKIALVNQTTCQLLGWEAKDLIGKLIVEFIPMINESGETLPFTDRPMTKVLSLGKQHVTSKTNYYIRKDKTKIPVHFTTTPIIINHKLVGTIEVFHDITKEKEIDRMKDDSTTTS